jgi:hypothetical protein
LLCIGCLTARYPLGLDALAPPAQCLFASAFDDALPLRRNGNTVGIELPARRRGHRLLLGEAWL